MTVAEALKRFRKEFRYSQDEISKKMKVSRTMYQAYEYGKSFPSVNIVINLAKDCGVSADYLLGLIDEPNPYKNSNAANMDTGKTLSDKVSDEELNDLTVAAEDNRLLDYHQTLSHVLAKQGIEI